MTTIPTQERKTLSHQETNNILDEFPLLEQIRNATREKVGSVLKGTIDRVGQWFRKKVDKLLPGLLAHYEKKVELPQSSISETEEDIRQREVVGEEFSGLLNQYRKNAGLRELSKDDHLMKLAEKVAGYQVRNGTLTHTEPSYRYQNGIQGEIIASGFSSPEEALKKFVDSENHYKVMMGSYGKVGYAIRPGIESSSGQTMYYLVVLFRGGKPMAPDKKGQKKIPKNFVPESPAVELRTLEQALENKPGLKPYFSFLEEQRKALDPEITYSFQADLTRKLPLVEKRAGLFQITFSKGPQNVSYKVTNSPARLQRLDKNKTLLELRFEDILDDVKDVFEEASKPQKKPELEKEAEDTETKEYDITSLLQEKPRDQKTTPKATPDSPKQ
jgi:hypothetical protein